jgi:hypothetical protein
MYVHALGAGEEAVCADQWGGGEMHEVVAVPARPAALRRMLLMPACVLSSAYTVVFRLTAAISPCHSGWRL